MTTYRAAEGHNVALVSLTVLSPAPDPGEGIRYTRVGRSANGSLDLQGAYYDFEWSEMSNSSYNTILGIFGVDDADNANVTIYVRDATYQNWVRMNGVAQRPLPGDTVKWNIRPRDITIRVTNLVASS